jgi:hypothetical protein
MLYARVIGAEDSVESTVAVEIRQHDARAAEHLQRRADGVTRRAHRADGRRDERARVVRAVEDQVDVAVLVEIEAMNRADAPVAADEQILS